MITIEIPAWLQWAAVGLAIAYAIPRAIRAVVVAIYWLSKLLRGRWPITESRIRGSSALLPVPVLADRKRVWEDRRFWALKTGAFEREHWPQLRERPEASELQRDSSVVSGTETGRK
ncbi:hypothetical protein [Candidatus Poriferisodalis sp.]|uniref:hypothetical protein n=1 Tax=Candidatus Poriferisodalis sp. TaxID=3101277 RepID=UPI003B5C11D9